MRMFQLPILTSQLTLLPQSTQGAFDGTCHIQSPTDLAIFDDDRYALMAGPRLSEMLGVTVIDSSGAGPVILQGPKLRNSRVNTLLVTVLQSSKSNLQKLLHQRGKHFSFQAIKALRRFEKQKSLNTEAVFEQLHKEVGLYVRYPGVRNSLKLSLTECLHAFGLTYIDALEGLKIVTYEEFNEAHTQPIRYSARTDVVLAASEEIYEDPFELLYVKTKEALEKGNVKELCEAYFYSDGEFASNGACFMFWHAVMKYLRPKEVALIFEAMRSPKDVALFIGAVYSPKNTDTLFEIKLVYALSELAEGRYFDGFDSHVTLSSVLEALLNHQTLSSIGVCLLADSQLYGGIERAAGWQTVYEFLVIKNNHWYQSLYETLVKGQVMESEMPTFLSVRPNDVKRECYLCERAWFEAKAQSSKKNQTEVSSQVPLSHF